MVEKHSSMPELTLLCRHSTLVFQIKVITSQHSRFAMNQKGIKGFLSYQISGWSISAIASFLHDVLADLNIGEGLGAVRVKVNGANVGQKHLVGSRLYFRAF